METASSQIAAPSGMLFNIQRHSTDDGPGIRTTLFFKGCPMRCSWCHNPEAIRFEPEVVWRERYCIGARSCLKACPRQALTLGRDGIRIDRERCDACGDCVDACPAAAFELFGKQYTVEQVIEQSLRDRVFYERSGGGVTLSGGEPASRPGFPLAVMDGLRRESIHTAVDTCGGVRWDLLHPVVERADLILYDLKIFDEASHLHHTGIPLQRVLENARRTAALEKPMWIRTPVIPGISDGAENIARIADFIIAHLPTVERYDLLAFNKTCIPKYQRLGRDFVLEREHLVSTEKMQSLISIARERGVENTHWSGFSS